MKRNDIRIMKMDRSNRSILMRALYADFCANMEAGDRISTTRLSS